MVPFKECTRPSVTRSFAEQQLQLQSTTFVKLQVRCTPRLYVLKTFRLHSRKPASTQLTEMLYLNSPCFHLKYFQIPIENQTAMTPSRQWRVVYLIEMKSVTSSRKLNRNLRLSDVRKTSKPRIPVSKLVSGKELTSEPVIRLVEQHEHEQKR